VCALCACMIELRVTPILQLNREDAGIAVDRVSAVSMRLEVAAPERTAGARLTTLECPNAAILELRRLCELLCGLRSCCVPTSAPCTYEGSESASLQQLGGTLTPRGSCPNTTSSSDFGSTNHVRYLSDCMIC